MKVPPRSLYIHVPFCAHRCGYCDFVTVSAQPELHERYVHALQREYALRALPDGHRFDTVFVGGGTPTLLEPAAREQLLGWISERLEPAAEITFECNPETVTPQLAASLVAGGVTRVSLGAQSFQEHVLATLERRADPPQVRAAVAVLREAGIEQLSLDIIWAVPGQSDSDLRADLREVVELAPDHVSAYELEFKPGTRLTHRHGTATTAIGDDADAQYDIVIDTLAAAGYEWYETANFARDGRHCRHNLAYWTQADYIGIGIGAVGTWDGERRANLPNLPRYLAAVEGGELPPARLEQLDDRTRRQERVILALRLARPYTLSESELEGVVDREGLERLAASGLTELSRSGDELTIELNRRGRMLLNSVLDTVLA